MPENPAPMITASNRSVAWLLVTIARSYMIFRCSCEAGWPW